MLSGRARLTSTALAVAVFFGSTPVSVAASPTASVGPSWELLEDLRILTNEDPADYAPRLEALLSEFRAATLEEFVARARDEEKLVKLRRARLTLARAQLSGGDKNAALRSLGDVQRANIGVDVDFGAMGPSLAALAQDLDTRRGKPPTITCAAPCVVLFDGRIVHLDTQGQAQSLEVPLGTYEVLLSSAQSPDPNSDDASTDFNAERLTVVVGRDGAAPANLRWPSTPAETETAAIAHAGADASPPGAGTASATRRKKTSLALGITGGVLVVIGAVLVGTRPGCTDTPCLTSPGVLSGLVALGAGIPLIAGALGVGLARDPTTPANQVTAYRLVIQARF